LAVLPRSSRELQLARVALPGIEHERHPSAALGSRLLQAVPDLGESSLVLVDSPRSPSDCGYSASPWRPLIGYSGGARLIDTRLRLLARQLVPTVVKQAGWRLSLFPTPRHDFFARCISDAACKPHLAALGRELLDLTPTPASDGAPRGGQLFTRFMLSGFATYRALEAAGAAAAEAYPDLQFRLWTNGCELPPKSAGRSALNSRKTIIQALAAALPLDGSGPFGAPIATMDQADAAILALTARLAMDSGAIGLIEEPLEGRFAVPLQAHQARSLGLDY